MERIILKENAGLPTSLLWTLGLLLPEFLLQTYIIISLFFIKSVRICKSRSLRQI